MLRKAMDVLALFSLEKREFGVLEVSEVLGRPKSTVSRWLAAMEQADFLDRDPETSRYRLSLRLTALGEVARHTTNLQRSARPALNWLAERTGETANLTLLVGTEAVNVEVADSPRPVMHVGWVGRRLPVHATASGKVLLAHADESTVATVLGAPLQRFTRETITSPTAFGQELQLVRTRGYATVWAELESDLAAVAAPVRDYSGVVVAAIAIGGPVSRCARSKLSALAIDVVSAAGALSEKMGYRAAIDLQVPARR
jgi:IclR family transcriptional regulator, KDG regulon repressor